MPAINLLDRYPRSKRPIDERGRLATEEHKRVAKHFGKDYFDGDRLHGYGGYKYEPRFWQETVKRIRDYYKLEPNASILDVGCAKGFMLHDFKELLPKATVAGIDVSDYAIASAMKSVKPFLRIGNAKELPFVSKSFDLVISINTIHNLKLDDCKTALQEIQRVSKNHCFVTVDAWRSEQEEERFLKWNLTAQTFMHVDEWRALFEEVGYTGDYYWFIAE
jgi:ubiquinone/menaquinone biosynthesis C-methylase UbiE